MGKMPINRLGKSSELKLHCFCLFDAYSMPKDIYSVQTMYVVSQYHDRTVKIVKVLRK